MKKFWLSPVAFCALLFPPLLFAQLTIHVTQGTDKPYPIEITSFEKDPKAPETPQGVSKIIANDLGMSGQFEVRSPSTAPSSPTEFSLSGQVTAVETGYEVSYKLNSTLGNHPLLNQTYHKVSAGQLRLVAHSISDRVYQVITGAPGIFLTRLAYVAVLHPHSKDPTYQLIVSDADGYHPHVLLEQTHDPIASPSWSPDGKTLTYVSYLKNRMTIYLIHLESGSREILVSRSGINSAPSFSPDGKFLAMALSARGSDQTNLFLMNLSTRSLKQLTKLGSNTAPAWSAKGEKILFTSDRSGTPQIYELNPLSLQSKRLTFQGLKNFTGMYLPNGTGFVEMYQDAGDSPIQIALFNFRSGEIQLLSRGELDKSPSVSPNGRMIVYATYDPYNGALAEVSTNGKIQLVLPTQEGSVQSPAWSPYLKNNQI